MRCCVTGVWGQTDRGGSGPSAAAQPHICFGGEFLFLHKGCKQGWHLGALNRHSLQTLGQQNIFALQLQ